VKKILVSASLPLFLLAGLSAAGPKEPEKAKTVSVRPLTLEQALSLWQSTERMVRDRRITRKDARQRFTWAFELIRERADVTASSQAWAFPLAGLRTGRYYQGSYRPKGFDFYAGSGKGSRHPAVDIFVRDRRRRGIDDATGRPVHVISSFDGIVVAAQPGWKAKDKTRGGVYTYVLQPATGYIAYYAHLKELNVVLGQVVRRGQVLGIVGRTGKNALKRRSETHLHYMLMRFGQGNFSIVNPIKRLDTAKRLPDPEDREAGAASKNKKM
jgi:murein DD-endopeptidase MepM/ murein hydrolase activator NlpD